MGTDKLKLVGITPRFETGSGQTGVSKAYTDSIVRAGAAPVILPLTGSAEVLEAVCARCDGFLFSGGPDIDPRYYGEEKRFDSVEVCFERDVCEAEIFRIALASRKPMLGICRGIQVFNVMLGGTLYQDIPSEYATELCHSRQPSNRIWHRVDICDGSPLRTLFDAAEIGVNTSHHQAVRTLAPGLRTMAFSEDGLIEAVNMPDHPFFWGVQWHPEQLWLTGPESAQLFGAFVAAMN